MDLRERLRSIEQAIENEVEEREFYLRQARASINPVSRATFEALANEELEHIERLKELHRTLSREGRWPDGLVLSLRASKAAAVVSSFTRRYREVFETDREALAAVKRAIEAEERSAAFYSRLREQVADPEEKAFFASLAGIEMEHSRALRDTEQLMADPLVWSRLRPEPPA